jgi:hypothetical protein
MKNLVRCDQNSVLSCSTAAVIIVVGFNGSLFFPTALERSSNIKFHENPSIGNRIVPFRQTY